MNTYNNVEITTATDKNVRLTHSYVLAVVNPKEYSSANIDFIEKAINSEDKDTAMIINSLVALNYQINNGGSFQWWDNGYYCKANCLTKQELEIFIRDELIPFANAMQHDITKLKDFLKEFEKLDYIEDETEQCCECCGTGYVTDYVYDADLDKYIDDEFECDCCLGSGQIDTEPYMYNDNNVDDAFYNIDYFELLIEQYAEYLSKYQLINIK